jgi:hypothetical protein
VEVWFDELWLASTAVIALRVFGVIVATAFARAEEGVCGLFIIDKNAAVFGDGGGKEIGPAERGVSPVLGARPVLNSVLSGSLIIDKNAAVFGDCGGMVILNPGAGAGRDK